MDRCSFDGCCVPNAKKSIKRTKSAKARNERRSLDDSVATDCTNEYEIMENVYEKSSHKWDSFFLGTAQQTGQELCFDGSFRDTARGKSINDSEDEIQGWSKSQLHELKKAVDETRKAQKLRPISILTIQVVPLEFCEFRICSAR